jgi:molybdopterin-guanine dinucleotide biosynthesis protein A
MVRALTGLVLTGGKSSRMGTDKAMLRLPDGATLLEHAIAVLSAVATEIRIIGSREKYGDVASSATIVEDIFPERGPLGGIHAALASTDTELNLVLAVDTPAVTPALLEYLVTRAAASDALVVVPEIEGRLQPLCAVYRKEFYRLAQRSLEAGRNKVDGAFEAASTLILRQDEFEAAGFSADLFRNLNTVEEWSNFNQVAKSD